MKQRFLPVLLSALCLTFLFSSALRASDTQVDGIWYDFNDSKQTASVTYRGSYYYSYDNEYSGSVVIPETVNYHGKIYSVTSIGQSAFYNCRGLTSITIPNSVTSIGYDAFRGCSSLPVIDNIRYADTYLVEAVNKNLSTYTIKEGTKWIKYQAFYNCSRLTSINIPNSVTSIGSEAFRACSSLTSVTIPNSVTSIGSSAFSGCSSLTSVTIPNSVTSIESSAFYGCSSLTSVTIPNSVTSIGSSAFYGCSSLTSVTIPNSVTSIGEYAFGQCSGLKNVFYNSKKCNDFTHNETPFTRKENGYICYVSHIISFTFGDEVEYIPEYLCFGMDNLTSVTIPNSVTSIGSGAFYYCSGLNSVTIGNSVTSIGYYAFYNCKGLEEPIYNNNIFAYLPKSYQGSYTIPNGIKSISTSAFSDCSGLTSITIPNSVTSIGSSAFSGCSSLTSVTIPNSVTSIESSAFYGCSSLTSVTIGNSVTSIGNSAFYGCSSLTSVTIPNSVTSIGESVFHGCSGLTSVTIGNSVTSIGSSAFSGCTGLTTMTIPNSVTSIGGSVFHGCSGLTSVTIGNSVTSIGDNAFYNCSGLTSVVWNATNCNSYNFGNQVESFTFGNEVKVIPDSICKNMAKLTSITIPNSVTSIGNYAFSGCSELKEVHISDIAKWCIVSFGNAYSNPLSFAKNLYVNGSLVTDLVIPEGVTSIGEYAFYGCSGLTSVTIPNSVTSIGEDAFSGCSGLKAVHISDLAAWCKISFGGEYTLTSNPLSYAHNLYLDGELVTDLVIPGNITSIGKSAFCGCRSLQHITIPNSVTSIEYGAFATCVGLTSVTIPNSVTSIGSSAFYGCSRLTSIEIPNSVTSIGSSAFYGCSRLTSIEIPNSVTSIGNYAFSGCNITSVVWNAKNCNSYNFGSQVESFTFGNEVEVIPASICRGMKKLTSITIPTSVTSIGKDAFLDCSGLTSIVWNAKRYKNLTATSTPFYYYEKGSDSNFDLRSQIISFTFGDKVEYIPAYLCSGMTELHSVTIPNCVTSIGNNAFNGCKSIESLSLGENITFYGDYAFQGCSALTTIYNYRERPAKLGTDVFKDVDYFNCTLHVLAGSVDMYKSAGSDWKDFYFVEPIGAAPTTTEKVEITPSDNTAGFVWPTVNNAASYELVIIDKQGNDVCTLIFDAQGHLTQIAFAAPDRNRAPEQTAEQVAGFSFTITGLNSGTTYHYTITSKDSNGNTLDTKTGTFRTQGGTATTYTLTVYSADATMGTVSGSGEYEEGDEVTLTATPADGYRFVRWSDDNTDNPRTIVLTEDMTFTAYFERIPDALEETDTDRTPSATKIFENGQLYILLPDNTRYNLQGMEVK